MDSRNGDPWENAKRIRARKRTKEDGTKVYEIWGPLFFGSITAFNDKFDVKNDPKSVEIDFIESRISDHSAIEAIFNLVTKYKQKDKKINWKQLGEDWKIVLHRSSPIFKEVILDAIEDPRYDLAESPEAFTKGLVDCKL